MNADEFRQARERAGLTPRAFALALGYSGAQAAMQTWRFEHGTRTIPAPVARLALMYARHGVPREFQDRSNRARKNQNSSKQKNLVPGG